MQTRSILAGLAGALISSVGVSAADYAPTPAAPPAPETCKATLTTPAFNGVIKANPNPTCVTVAGLGDIYIGGALTGYGYVQTNPFPRELALPLNTQPDRGARFDFSNLQGWVQKADGPFQFYIQGGGYVIPQLGFPNYGSVTQTDLLFGPLPVAFGKWQINDNWSIQGGRLYTIIGTEGTFTFQNLNINRGLLFVQENFINQGVQLNWSDGPWAVSVAGTDGFFSGDLTWFTGNVSYKIDDASTVGVNGGVNLGRQNTLLRSPQYQFATPNLQQNSGIFNINYTYSNGPWIIQPYFQFTNVERDLRVGIPVGASTYGGAILGAYAFNENFALAGRVEYEQQSGRRGLGDSAANLLGFGAGSNAFSVTVTPTFTLGRYFLRLEYAHVQIGGITRGSLADGTLGTGFGRDGNRTQQDRYMIETGVVF